MYTTLPWCSLMPSSSLVATWVLITTGKSSRWMAGQNSGPQGALPPLWHSSANFWTRSAGLDLESFLGLFCFCCFLSVFCHGHKTISNICVLVVSRSCNTRLRIPPMSSRPNRALFWKPSSGSFQAMGTRLYKIMHCTIYIITAYKCLPPHYFIMCIIWQYIYNMTLEDTGRSHD